MAETTSPRFGLNLWGAESDTVSRSEFNNNFKNLEDNAAIDRSGTLANRPVYGKIGTYYYATDLRVLFRDTGTAWVTVGGILDGLTSTAPNASSQAATFKGAVNQSGDLVRHTTSAGSVLSAFTKDGALKSGGVYVTGNRNEASSSRFNNAALSVESLLPDQPGQVNRARLDQLGNLHEWRDASNRVVSRINAQGQFVSARPMKAEDTNAVENNELVTYGQIKRSLPSWNIVPLSYAEYNALMVKDPQTLYIING